MPAAACLGAWVAPGPAEGAVPQVLIDRPFLGHSGVGSVDQRHRGAGREIVGGAALPSNPKPYLEIGAVAAPAAADYLRVPCLTGILLTKLAPGMYHHDRRIPGPGRTASQSTSGWTSWPSSRSSGAPVAQSMSSLP